MPFLAVLSFLYCNLRRRKILSVKNLLCSEMYTQGDPYVSSLYKLVLFEPTMTKGEARNYKAADPNGL